LVRCTSSGPTTTARTAVWASIRATGAVEDLGERELGLQEPLAQQIVDPLRRQAAGQTPRQRRVGARQDAVAQRLEATPRSPTAA